MYRDIKKNRAPALLLFICGLLLLASCQPVVLRQETPAHTGARQPATAAMPNVTLSDAELAFNAGDMVLAEKIAAEFTARTDADRAQLSRGWRILALSSLENLRPMVTLTALDRWRIMSPKVNATAEWCETWYSALAQLPFAEASTLAGAVISADVRHKEALAAARASGKSITDIVEPHPWQQVREARLFLLETRLNSIAGRSALPELERLYNSTAQLNQKRELETRLFSFLHKLSRQVLQNLYSGTSDANENRYPYALVRLENSRRSFWDVKNQSAATESVNFLRYGSLLAETGLFHSWNQPDYSALKKLRVNNDAVALVLPLTGPYGNLSEKIARGAEIARQGMEEAGKAPRLMIIDSDQPNWLYEVANLPRSVRVVGGPLRLEDYAAVKSMGFTADRAWFTFLPRMDEHDEGLKAWRFFPSREDQVRVMLDYALALGLDNYAIFAPDTGEYNQSMFDLFHTQAAAKYANIVRAGYYPSGQYTKWADSVSTFLSVYSDTRRASPQTLDFQALFLPDNWSNSSRVISHIFYSIENNLLFMGTNLWEHGLGSQQRLALRNYRLAVFPGVWDPQSLTPSGQLLRGASAVYGKYTADFWLSLGYDFMLMATSLNLPSDKPVADDVNSALARLPALPWSGAPVSWNGQGFARQELFVLAPAENGFTRADTERIKARLEQARLSMPPSLPETQTPAAVNE